MPICWLYSVYNFQMGIFMISPDELVPGKHIMYRVYLDNISCIYVDIIEKAFSRDDSATIFYHCTTIWSKYNEKGSSINGRFSEPTSANWSFAAEDIQNYDEAIIIEDCNILTGDPKQVYQNLKVVYPEYFIWQRKNSKT